MNCDVLVVGGGSAGLAAAVAAAGSGAKTCLVERNGFSGGMATAALVHSICGLYKLGEPGAYANPGFTTEFARRLLERGGATGPVRLGRVEVLFHRPVAFATLADELLENSRNLELRFHSELIAASETLDTVEISCRGVRETLTPRVAIDTTGDATLAALSGAECEMADPARLQRPAYVIRLEGVEPAALDDTGRLRLARAIAQGVHAGKLPEAALGVTFRAVPENGGLFATINLEDPVAAEAYDPLDPACLTRLEIAGRKLSDQLIGYLAGTESKYSALRLAAHPVRVGVRESRRLVGRQRVETKDVENGSSPADTVAWATWPQELREKANSVALRFPEENRPCGIPLGALRCRDRENLFAAGRCLSSSHKAQASLRVIGTCLATGEAAGLAAALVADGKSEPTRDQIDAGRNNLIAHEYR